MRAAPVVLLAGLVLVAPAAGPRAQQPSAQPAAAGRLTIDALIDIRHPSNPIWSPDGRRVAFVSDRAGVQNIGVVDVTGSAQAPPRALTAYQAGDVGGLFWSRDAARLYFSKDGDLWAVSSEGSQPPRAVWTTPALEGGIVPSPDGTAVAFTRGGDVWTRSLIDARETQITRTPAQEGAIAWSPDGTRLSFTTSTSTRREEAPEYSGAKILYTYIERASGDVYVAPSTGGQSTAIMPSTEFRESGARWIDSTHLVFERVHDDTTKREIVVADVTTGQGRVVVREVDEKWWSITGSARPGPQPSPDGRWILFVSDRDGWDHLYVVAPEGGTPVPLTRGSFETWRPAWSPDGRRIAFDANEPERPGVRHVGIVDLGTDPTRATARSLTFGRGTNISPAWSPDGTRLVFQHTDPENSADLFMVEDDGPSQMPRATRLTVSMPPAVDRSALVEPKLVWYVATDGKKVPAYLFVPKNLDTSRKHPAIVWIHGDGVNQNYDGWHVERNYAVYYSFHQYLLQRGYVVIAPDYRGSIGYGKAWRQGVFLDVGGKDREDAVEAASYLKTLGYVDPDRIGVWGLSYGGFFTLLALVDAPKTFAAGVDVAGVVDYRMYYNDPWHGAWTYARLRAPEDNPKAYDVASPLSRMGSLERPLLILHGTADVNVPYLHSVRLVDDLLKRGKTFELMVYPGEFHYFTRAHVLRDAWQRVEQFFDRYLRP